MKYVFSYIIVPGAVDAQLGFMRVASSIYWLSWSCVRLALCNGLKQDAENLAILSKEGLCLWEF